MEQASFLNLDDRVVAHIVAKLKPVVQDCIQNDRAQLRAQIRAEIEAEVRAEVAAELRSEAAAREEIEIRQALKDIKSPFPDRRCAVAKFFGEKNTPQSLFALAMLGEDSNPEVQCAAVTAATRLWPASQPFLEKMLNSDEATVRELVIQEFACRHTERVAGALLARLTRERMPKIRESLAIALIQIERDTKDISLQQTLCLRRMYSPSPLAN